MDGDLSASPPFRRDAHSALGRERNGEQPRCHGDAMRMRGASVTSGDGSGTNSRGAWTRIAAPRRATRAIRNAESRINAMEAEDERKGDDERLVREAEAGSAADSASRDGRPTRPRSSF
jgi:hypothetical protein